MKTILIKKSSIASNGMSWPGGYDILRYTHPKYEPSYGTKFKSCYIGSIKAGFSTFLLWSFDMDEPSVINIQGSISHLLINVIPNMPESLRSWKFYRSLAEDAMMNPAPKLVNTAEELKELIRSGIWRS